jgi:hypothetical protein
MATEVEVATIPQPSVEDAGTRSPITIAGWKVEGVSVAGQVSRSHMYMLVKFERMVVHLSADPCSCLARSSRKGLVELHKSGTLMSLAPAGDVHTAAGAQSGV